MDITRGKRIFKFTLIWGLLALFAFLYAGCSSVEEEQVNLDFKKMFPDVEIISIDPGEGDSDNVYYHIKYTKQGSESKEVVFLYQYNSLSDLWELNPDFTKLK